MIVRFIYAKFESLMPKVFFSRNKNAENGVNGFRLKKSILKTVAKPLLGIIGLFSVVALAVSAIGFILPQNPKTPGNQNDQSVLAASTEAVKLLGKVTFNIPSIFNDTVTFKRDVTVDAKSFFNEDVKVNNKNVDLGTGDLTAANVLYGVTAGKGLTSTGGQNPTLSVSNAVTSVQGATGDVTLTAGSGIS